jgi:hypothetical protein
MSTRSTTHFQENGQDIAIVYRHSDGYPEGAGVDLLRFIGECAKLQDSRLSDPSYLAAKYVVFLADMFNRTMKKVNGEYKYVKSKSKLEFLGVGVLMEDPGDIRYRYIVDCGNIVDGKPKVTCNPVSCSYPENIWKQGPEVAIPASA